MPVDFRHRLCTACACIDCFRYGGFMTELEKAVADLIIAYECDADLLLEIDTLKAILAQRENYTNKSNLLSETFPGLQLPDFSPIFDSRKA